MAGVHVLGCCFVAWWVCYSGARGMCRGWCGVVRRCSGKCAVSRGCGVWLLTRGSLGWWFRSRVRFGLWLVVGVELVRGVWGIWGWYRRGGGVQSWRGAVSFLCWWAAVSHVPGVGELVRRHVLCGTFRWSACGRGGGVRCGVVALGRVLASLLGGGYRVRVRWAGWLLVVGPRVVRGCPARSLGRSSGVCQSVGRVRSLQREARGRLGRGV